MFGDWACAHGRVCGAIAFVTCVLLSFTPAGMQHANAEDETAPRRSAVESTVCGDRRETGLPPTLESWLAQLVVAAEADEPSHAAGELSIALEDGRVEVLVTCEEPRVDDVAGALRQLDVDVEDRWRGEMICLAEPSALRGVAALEGVLSVRLPPKPVLCDITTEALGLINADDWLDAGLDGAGIKIGVLDVGFAGYAGLLGTELPSSVSTYFPSGAGTDNHGTACAELIHDIAPGASLYFATCTNSVNWHTAADWLIGQGVDVISCSLAWLGTGPRDGTSSICAPIEDARDEGILWVQSAANYAEGHWSGSWRDTNSNQWHEFDTSPLDEANELWAATGEVVRIHLFWDDPWGSSTNDYDLYVTDSAQTVVWASENEQSGSYPYPAELVQFTAPDDDLYLIWVHEWDSSRTVDLELFSEYGFYYSVPAGSMCDNSASADCLTVGAVDWSTPSTLESFSSRGPTADGRTKPDLVGPDWVSTDTYGTEGFGGTSAAAPHVAGTAALVKQAYPDYDADDIQSYLESNAVGLGASGKDNSFGSGRVLLPAAPPTLDFGDAPNSSYATLLASNGARHTALSGLFLGAGVDTEYDGQPNATATGDDLAGDDDEDGVVFLTDLMAGEQATVRVTCSEAGYLGAWLDLNDDGDWADAGESVIAVRAVPSGASDLQFDVPLTATPTASTFARFRLSQALGMGYFGHVDEGEVEDYRVEILPAPPAPPGWLTGFAYHSTKVFLEWEPGLASDEMVVVRKAGGYPASIDDGTTVYSGSDRSCTDTGLSAGTDYYYCGWSYATATGLYCVTPAQTMVTTLPAEADWTFMVYLDADNNLEDVADLDIAEMASVGSSPEVNIIVQLDRYSEPGCWRQYVGNDGAFTVGTAPELNMAAPGNLADFVDWAATTYPAAHYALVLWDHGSGALGAPEPAGVIYDESHLDLLSCVELGQALSEMTTHVDLLDFDACQMQMYEVCCELSLASDPPDVVVGSEDDVPGEGLPYDAILAFLVAAPSSTSEALAAEMVAEYLAEYSSSTRLTVSGVALPESSLLNSTIQTFAAALIGSDYPSAIVDARGAAQRFSTTEYRDLVHFCDLVIATAPDCATEAQAVKDLVSSMLVAEGHTTGTGVDDAHGLSIYLPDVPDNYDDRYEVLGIAGETWWDDFLRGGYDFGDAPDPAYATLRASDGARHALGGPCLGAAVDADIDGLPTAAADGDDVTSVDDEDGVTFAGVLKPGEQASVTVVASQAGFLDAWVDFNDDGDWADSGEQVFSTQALAGGANALQFAVPSDATLTGSTFARFRLSSAGGLGASGAAPDGEIEDYEVAILETIDVALKIGWNMVSVPLNAPDPSPGAVFPGVDVVYTWDPASKSYSVPAAILPQKAYWVGSSSEVVLTVAGVPVETWTQSLPHGWNMTGSLYGSSPSIADPDDVPPGSVEGFAYTWVPATKSYAFVSVIEPGKGYWMAATQDSQLTLSPPV